MRSDPLLRWGIIGTVITALCCFTPVLVILLTAVGFASLVPALDPILIPAFLTFVSITLWALIRRAWRRREPS